MRFSIAFVTLAAAGACAPAFAAPAAAYSSAELSRRQDIPDADPRLSIGTVTNLGNAFIHGLSTGQDLVNLVNGQQTQKRQDADGNPFDSFVQQFFKDHPNQVFHREQAEKRQDAFANFLQQFFANSNTLPSRDLDERGAASAAVAIGKIFGKLFGGGSKLTRNVEERGAASAAVAISKIFGKLFGGGSRLARDV
ncbi:hypothetical protein FA95DRAFT_1609654 [Auriscalpium vulgare]|uniref:Uncharacterized protein n=1 Tax=Auriscalpium vulgare TaxID=40419 RepID=A0ACB8RG04_9AGAM|nr:hypothetical protein FA95DRAFT_1609654 [Auriscalpium vulgare]